MFFRKHDGLIDIFVGKLEEAESFMNATFNFTNYINFIGLSHEMYDHENNHAAKENNVKGFGGIWFYILNKAFGINGS